MGQWPDANTPPVVFEPVNVVEPVEELFEAVRLFNTDSSKGEMTPDEEFEIILRCLNYEAPETWRDRIQSRGDNILRHWGRTSPAEGVQNWQNEQAVRWQSIAENWIREANNLPFDDGLEFLSSHMVGKIPPEAKDKLTARIDFLYEKMLEGKIRNIRSAKSIKELAKIYQ